MKKRIDPFRPVHPTPAALITTMCADGMPNIITLGEVFNVSISEPVIVGIAIAPGRLSHENITRTREFVVNLPTAAIVEQVDMCGTVSGRDCAKFPWTGLTPVDADEVAPPLIDECPINIECRLTDQRSVGDHDLFLAEAVAVHVNESVIDEKGITRIDRMDMLVYARGIYFSAGAVIGRHGYTARGD